MVNLQLHPGQMTVFKSRSRFKVVVAGRRWGKCLAPSTPIAMADGTYKRVEDVRAGDSVLTINEDTYALEPKPVKHLHDNGVKDTLRVVTRSGQLIELTPNHPLLANNTWTEARDLKLGDLVAVPRSTVFGNKQIPKHELDMLAIWLAEGADYRISNGTPEIISVMENFVKEFGGDLKLKKETGVDWAITNGKRTGGSQAGTKNPVRSALEKYGVWGLNSKTKFIPNEIFSLPRHQLARFLNLFIACDGSINLRSKNTWAVEIGLANEKMVRQLADLLLKFGIRGQISHKVHSRKSSVTERNFESWRFITSDSKSIETFCEEIGSLSKEEKVDQALLAARASAGSSNNYLPISYDDFVEHLSYEPESKGKYGGYNYAVARELPDELRSELNGWRKITATRVTERRYERLRGFSDGYYNPIADGDVAWDEIVSIEPVGRQQTYDLTIEDNHNFIAGGIVTHNTQLAKTTIIKMARVRKRKVWYVAPTYQMAKQIMWDDLLDAIPNKWIKKINETRMTIRLVNGTIIECKGADNPDTLRGVGLHFVVLDEFQDMKPDVWTTVLRPTLASTGGHALFIGTPKSFNHLYELYVLGQKEDYIKLLQWESWQYPTITSPFIPKSEIDAARRDMDEKSFKQEFEASFETMAGRVYYPFDRRKHVGDYPFDPDLPIWVGQDFNIDPMSSVIFQPQRNGELWAIDEIVLPGSNTVEVCDELEKRYWRYQDKMTIYPDPAGGQRQHARGETDLDIFRERGFRRLKYHRKHPPIADRVNAVNSMLMSADGQIRMRVDKRCKFFIEGLEQTIYKPGSRDVDKTMNVEHSPDAGGYCIQYEFPMRKIDIRGISI